MLISLASPMSFDSTKFYKNDPRIKALYEKMYAETLFIKNIDINKKTFELRQNTQHHVLCMKKDNAFLFFVCFNFISLRKNLIAVSTSNLFSSISFSTYVYIYLIETYNHLLSSAHQTSEGKIFWKNLILNLKDDYKIELFRSSGFKRELIDSPNLEYLWNYENRNSRILISKKEK